MGNFTPIILLTLAIFGVNGAPSVEEARNYEGYQVFRTTATTEQQLLFLKGLDDEGIYDFWMGPFKTLGSQSDIMVSPEQREGLVEALKVAGIHFEVMIQDVEMLVNEQKADVRQSGNLTWTEYHRMGTVYAWLENLAAANPSLVSLENYGTSTEGRDLKMLKISTGGSTNKPAFWIDANIHAREWISPAVATYVINQLVNNASFIDLRNSIDFYFAPMMNPDGYEYTHLTDRMWRKSRKTNPGSSCLGSDINRNFGFKWGIDDTGSSPNPCSETHRGPAAYSEPEAEGVKDFIKNRENTTNWTAFITLHSYSQLWMSPYGYSATELPEDLAELVEISDRCVAALTSFYGTQYETGAASQILYTSNGSSRDWAKGEGGFKWVYTIELRDQGRYGFLLPADQILPTAVETWAGIQVLAQHIVTK